MSELIIHIGPAKCGSSSIQRFFLNNKASCKEAVQFIRLNPADVVGLNARRQKPDSSETLRAQTAEALSKHSVVVISHEVMFQCPTAVARICAMCKDLASRITVVGYCRQQSSFMLSAWSQWLFRSRERTQEIATVIDDHSINPLLLTSVERCLLAGILDNFHSARQLSNYSILDWNKTYAHLIEQINDDSVVIKVGTLPSLTSDTSLIEDFCTKCNLTLQPDALSAAKTVENLSFHPKLVEALNVALTQNVEIPKPHEQNDWLHKLSADLKPSKGRESNFVMSLKACVDSRFYAANCELCHDHALDTDYFKPSRYISREQAIAITRDEIRKRLLFPSSVVDEYRDLVANLSGLLREKKR